MSSENFDLPAPLREIAAVIGRDAALLLAGRVLRNTKNRHGKVLGWIYIPKTLRPGRQIIELAGEENARRLVARLGGQSLVLSNPTTPVRKQRDAEIRRMHAQGYPTSYLAAWFDLSARQVNNILR